MSVCTCSWKKKGDMMCHVIDTINHWFLSVRKIRELQIRKKN